MFCQRIIIDLIQGDDPVVRLINEPVTKLAVPEEPVFFPYTLDSPELRGREEWRFYKYFRERESVRYTMLFIYFI